MKKKMLFTKFTLQKQIQKIHIPYRIIKTYSKRYSKFRMYKTYQLGRIHTYMYLTMLKKINSIRANTLSVASAKKYFYYINKNPPLTCACVILYIIKNPNLKQRHEYANSLAKLEFQIFTLLIEDRCPSWSYSSIN